MIAVIMIPVMMRQQIMQKQMQLLMLLRNSNQIFYENKLKLTLPFKMLKCGKMPSKVVLKLHKHDHQMLTLQETTLRTRLYKHVIIRTT